MILLWLIGIPIVAGVVAWAAAKWQPVLARWVALVAVSADLVLALVIWARHFHAVSLLPGGAWFENVAWAWIPSWGAQFHLAMDGLSLLLVLLTLVLGLVSVLASWREIRDGVGYFHLNLLWVLAGIVGVFLAVDLLLFYIAWEVMLVPMFFLIVIWGHEHRVYAAVKFFLFTQISSLLMLIAILGLYFAHHAATGTFTFEYAALIGTPLRPTTAMWLMLGFFVAFAVKLPMFPLHTWLPDAHTEAPTAGSIILAGLLLKTGAYGMLRFVVPLFPGAAHRFAPVAMTLAVIGIVYGAVVAFGQTDLKRLVAYTSVSHLGFVLFGIFAWNSLALQGALIGMICHGFSTGALFVIVGALQERTHTRDMDQLGGLWATIPRLSGAGLFFALASMGLPGLGDFVGEFLVLLGTYREHLGLTIVAVLGILASTFYALRFVQRAFHGPNTHDWSLADALPRELLMLVPMMAILLWLGLWPQPVLDTFRPAMQSLQQSVGRRFGQAAGPAHSEHASRLEDGS
ncbi:MAG TPA: NADH-quinone oxidoreductase subunit M [Gemmatimonadaceae bacterium]|nr:NADH-quinone oxidoreductase subunit M [Gemmatimonadaceae bacterium]